MGEGNHGCPDSVACHVYAELSDFTDPNSTFQLRNTPLVSRRHVPFPVAFTLQPPFNIVRVGRCLAKRGSIP